MEETNQLSKRLNVFRKVREAISGRLVPRNLRRKARTEEPWARIRERKGCKTLVWGMGDGKTFGSIPLDSEVAFSVDAEGVNLRSGNGDCDPVLIGSPGNETGNAVLARKIEKLFRKPEIPSWIVWTLVAALVLAGTVLMVGSGFSGLGHLASLSPELSGPGGGTLPEVSDIPSSMSSGLTCHTH
ncbi:MAG: hypothetical protein ACYCXP_08605 [Leptospirillum sp.]